jgi:hypothetical protein
VALRAASLADAGRILGALGASKGGYARAKSLSAKQRSAIASHAATQRWEARKHLEANIAEPGKHTLF